MSRRNYKINESIKVLFKATNGSTSVNMDVFDETDTQDVAQSGAMTQLGASNRWIASFTPDANGDWSILCSDNKGGEVVKHFSVGDYNIQSIGANVQSVETKVDNLNDISVSEVNSEVDTALADYDAPTKAELDISEQNIRGTDGDDLKSLSDQIDGLSSPPMIG